MRRILTGPNTPPTPRQYQQGKREIGCAGYVVPGTPCLLVPVSLDPLNGRPLCREHTPTLTQPLDLFQTIVQRLTGKHPMLLESLEGNFGIEHTVHGIKIHWQLNNEQPFLLWWDSASGALSEPVCHVLKEFELATR